jgi:hypothetical protein
LHGTSSRPPLTESPHPDRSTQVDFFTHEDHHPGALKVEQRLLELGVDHDGRESSAPRLGAKTRRHELGTLIDRDPRPIQRIRIGLSLSVPGPGKPSWWSRIS